MPASTAAVLICTRNRPIALRNTLASIAHQHAPSLRTIILVDASDATSFEKNQRTVERFTAGSVLHHRYEGAPSAAGQRNLGLQLLPDSVDVVFFLDDDVTLLVGCLRHLATALETTPEWGGVGAVELPAAAPPQATTARTSLLKRFFLIDHSRPGQVLLSGHVSSYSALQQTASPQPTQWLSTCCCAYRCSALRTIRFDEALHGALLEDRDFSYRVASSSNLAVIPKARFVHHRSPINRRSTRQFAYERAVQRYWFSAKNLDHPLRKPAYWWATIGHVMALLTSRKAEKWDALSGHVRGIRAVLTASDPLLRNSEKDVRH